MPAFRLFLACLLMLALPLQGLAAASMLHCGMKLGQHAVAMKEAPAPHVGHDHASHRHVDQAEGHGHHQPQAQPDTQTSSADQAQTGHKCASCAYCAHAVALAEMPRALEFGVPAHRSAAEPAVQIQPMTVRLPDKPPRA